MTNSDRFTKSWPVGLPCPYGPYRAAISGVHDGDTVTALVDAGLGLLTEIDVRIYGIQAPELTRGDAASRAAGAVARDFLRCLLPEGTPVRVTTLLATGGEQSRSFIRYVAQVEFGAGRDVAVEMVGAGHAFWCNRDLKPINGPPPPIERWVEKETARWLPNTSSG